MARGWRGTPAGSATVISGGSRAEILAEAKATDEAEESSMVTRVVMSCPSSCARRRAGASSSRRPSGSSPRRTGGQERAEEEPSSRAAPSRSSSLMRSGSWRAPGSGGVVARGPPQLEQHRWQHPTRFRARARSVCCWRPSGWRRSWPPSAAGNEAYEQFAAPPARTAGAGSAGRRSRTSRPRCRRGR